MKIIIVNYKIKHKSNKILGVIRKLVLDFILYFLLIDEKVIYTCNISTGYNTKNTIHH